MFLKVLIWAESFWFESMSHNLNPIKQLEEYISGIFFVLVWIDTLVDFGIPLYLPKAAHPRFILIITFILAQIEPLPKP